MMRNPKNAGNADTENGSIRRLQDGNYGPIMVHESVPAGVKHVERWTVRKGISPAGPHEVDDVVSAFGKYPAINRTDDSGSGNKHAHEVNRSLELSEIGLPYYCEQN